MSKIVDKVLATLDAVWDLFNLVIVEIFPDEWDLIPDPEALDRVLKEVSDGQV